MTDPLATLVGQPVVLTGTAGNAKLGAVLAGAGWNAYLDGVADWGDCAGRVVRAGGLLVQAKLAHDPVDEHGNLRQGMWGEAYLLRDPTWQVVDAHPHTP